MSDFLKILGFISFLLGGLSIMGNDPMMNPNGAPAHVEGWVLLLAAGLFFGGMLLFFLGKILEPTPNTRKDVPRLSNKELDNLLKIMQSKTKVKK